MRAFKIYGVYVALLLLVGILGGVHICGNSLPNGRINVEEIVPSFENAGPLMPAVLKVEEPAPLSDLWHEP